VSDPFAVLGLSPTATLDEVRAARRRLAKELHPDRHAGDAEAARAVAERRMQEVNAAFDRAVRALLRPQAPPPPSPGRRATAPPAPAPVVRVRGVHTDVSSFVVDVLRAEAFEALLIVASWLGDVLDADPPGTLELHLFDPECYCRLDLVPEAGASMVSVTVGAVDGAPPPPTTDFVRDLFVNELNRLADGRF
jgi:hypothetical protein